MATLEPLAAPRPPTPPIAQFTSRNTAPSSAGKHTPPYSRLAPPALSNPEFDDIPPPPSKYNVALPSITEALARIDPEPRADPQYQPRQHDSISRPFQAPPVLHIDDVRRERQYREEYRRDRYDYPYPKQAPQPGPSQVQYFEEKGPPYGEAVKRHLDGYDIDHALNGVASTSREVLNFSEYYRQKSHESQRTGPRIDTIPTLQEVDDMLRAASRQQESLSRLREAVATQQAELAEMSRAQVKVDDAEDKTGFDGKKRRGRAAPPGKCHSCNRVDTPEWRRGPDGARTLCNACGLHYAKLNRKAGVVKAAVSGSSLRPKE